MHVYGIRPRKDKRGVDLISDVLPFGRLWYGEPDAISYAKFFSRSHHAVIRVCNGAANVIETDEQAGDFKQMVSFAKQFGRLRGTPARKRTCRLAVF
jgi:hypothetical protein